MSSELTPIAGLFKAIPGTSEPFRTTDLNANWDIVDNFLSEHIDAIADHESRLGVVEADDWVTSARIAANAVGNSELAAESVDTENLRPRAVQGENIALNAVTPDELSADLDFATVGNVVKVASQSAGDSSTLAASTAFVSGAVATVSASIGTAISANNTSRGIPAKFLSGVKSGTTNGAGEISQSFTVFSATPVVTATLFNVAAGSSGNLVVTLASVSNTGVTWRVYDSSGATAASESVTVHWIAVQA